MKDGLNLEFRKKSSPDHLRYYSNSFVGLGGKPEPQSSSPAFENKNLHINLNSIICNNME